MSSILITGGTGSFGRAFARRLLDDSSYNRIVIYSRGEHAQEDMHKDFNDDRLRFFIGDVRDKDRLEFAMRGVEEVVHAAALKIVPTAEYNPTECVATNIYGAENVVKAAIRTGVRKVVALSTDKAVNPVNLYGATKLAAEKIFMAASSLAAGKTLFSVVRYGNVHGSNGSVVPLFKALGAAGKPLTVTDKRMTRFWITMPQALDLVTLALHRQYGQEILIPKIPSIKVIDLAVVMARLNPRQGSIAIVMTGIRPGEKLHETLLTEDESRDAWHNEYCYRISCKENDENWLKVDPGFRYSSDTNTLWLSQEQMQRLL